MIGEVETISNINASSVNKWKTLQSLGYTCTIFVPKTELKLARDLCFENKLIEKINEDDIVEGIVKNLTDYGAFIDLGGIDGLLHITDIPSLFII